MSETELNPCPICEGKAIMGIYYRLRHPMRYYAVCTECGLRSAIYKNKETVKTQWNRRTTRISEGKEGKIFVLDEIHTEQGGFFKLPNGAYSHYSCGNPITEKELSNKLGKVKVRKVPLSNGKSCTDFLKLWQRIKENKNAENKG